MSQGLMVDKYYSLKNNKKIIPPSINPPRTPPKTEFSFWGTLILFFSSVDISSSFCSSTIDLLVTIIAWTIPGSHPKQVRIRLIKNDEKPPDIAAAIGGKIIQRINIIYYN